MVVFYVRGWILKDGSGTGYYTSLLTDRVKTIAALPHGTCIPINPESGALNRFLFITRR